MLIFRVNTFQSPIKKMKVHLKSLGCRLNEAELEQWSQQYIAQGYSISGSAEDADLLVLNTCAVTNEASRKSRNLINRLQRNNPRAKLVVTGCHSSLNAQQTADTKGVDLVIPNQQKPALATISLDKLHLSTKPRTPAPDDIALYSRGRHRAFIKIQDGCRYRCSFCIVTVARGDERSRSVEEIVEDIRRFDEQGINEAVLTGVHVGGFGSDNESSLFELVEKILADTDIQRLRFASVEPWDLPDHFFSLFNDKRVMPHMHLPLQSGSDTVLRRMSRRCKTQEFSALVDKARSHVDGFNVTSDIIVGFPGETEQEWQQTMKFVESTGFGHLHIFPYSPRTGTKAARLDDQIDTQTKRRRIKELTELANAMKKTSLQKAINTTQAVLWEKPSKQADGQIIYHGYTPNFHRVKTVVSGNNSLEHQVTDTNITAIDSTDLALTGITTDRDD